MSQIRYLVGFPDFNQLDKISILGGEPTLHPAFSEIVMMIRQANSSAVIQLFSHCGNQAEKLCQIDCNNLVLVANCYSDRDNPNVEENLRVAREKGWVVALSYTIATPEIDTDGIIAFCKKHGIRIVRWSLAMPAHRVNSTYVPISEYAKYLEDIKLFTRRLLQNKIVSYNDCPLPCCLVGNDQLRYASTGSVYTNGVRYGICQPPYDIYPGNVVTGCMGIGERIKFDLRTVRSVSELSNVYTRLVAALRKECSNADIYEAADESQKVCFGFY